MTSLTLPYPPSSNRYWRVANNRIHRSDEATAYIAAVWGICNNVGIVKLAGELCVQIVLYRPIKSGDLDNRIKIVLDALQQKAYANDKQIVQIHAWRKDDKKNPRVEVYIDPVEEN